MLGKIGTVGHKHVPQTRNDLWDLFDLDLGFLKDVGGKIDFPQLVMHCCDSVGDCLPTFHLKS